jgi:predicted ABC-type ATPase
MRTAPERSAVLSIGCSAFETVFSDPVGEKVEFLRAAVEAEYTVVLCFIGLDKPQISDDRVAMRVLQGGHDIPAEKLMQRYPRSLSNLRRAVEQLPFVWVYDNSDLSTPFRKVAEYAGGVQTASFAPLPPWLPQGRAMSEPAPDSQKGAEAAPLCVDRPPSQISA